MHVLSFKYLWHTQMEIFKKDDWAKSYVDETEALGRKIITKGCEDNAGVLRQGKLSEKHALKRQEKE